MHDTLHVHPYIGILEPDDLLAAPMAVRKQGEGIARELVQNRIVVASGDRHRLYGSTRLARSRASGPLTLPYPVAVLCRNGPAQGLGR